MPNLESLIHLCFVLALPVMGVIAMGMGIKTFTLGTQAHQEECKEKIKASTSPDTSTHEAYYLGFFHLYPNVGGGGERVLWTMIKAIQDKYPFMVCVIYSGDSLSRDSILQNVQAKFGLTIRPETIYVVELTNRWWVDYKFPRLTLLMQSLGSLAVASQAIHRFCPDVFIDTVGFAFTYPLIHLLSTRIPVVAYTHYPAISSDMQTMVSSREAGFNNEAIARSALMSKLKSMYYRVFALAYSFAGSFASTIMTNSSWTQNHIVQLFGKPQMTKVVYPPCDTLVLAEFPLVGRQPLVMSLAQFRPEKNHRLQIEAFAHLLKAHPEFVMPASERPLDPEALLANCRDGSGIRYPVLVMIGGARNIEDEARAEELRQMAARLGIDRQVLVIVNAPWSQILEWLRFGKVGMHTMRDEHFGINIVEMMAAGLLTVAHDSAGPKLDIIVPAIRGAGDVPTDEECLQFPVGFVATTAEQFAESIAIALGVSEKLAEGVQRAARTAASAKFSEDAFRTAFYRSFGPVVRWLDNQRSADDDD
ncbi:asparagine-linked glycosylation protein [Coemansia sp. IMI 209128]|nr:asparagine-linked glycosylation protein [Coemansia sp. RSA 2530]KAJ2699984.1 asparagine-linked glycosylation protein [Coemansia sp. IMI 209128]